MAPPNIQKTVTRSVFGRIDQSRARNSGEISCSSSCEGSGSAPSACSKVSRFLSSYSLAIPSLTVLAGSFALHTPASVDGADMVNSVGPWKTLTTPAFCVELSSGRRAAEDARRNRDRNRGRESECRREMAPPPARRDGKWAAHWGSITYPALVEIATSGSARAPPVWAAWPGELARVPSARTWRGCRAE
jgi:hypothetical protein